MPTMELRQSRFRRRSPLPCLWARRRKQLPEQPLSRASGVLGAKGISQNIKGAEGSKQRVYIEPDSATMVADPIVRSMSREELEKSIANTTALMKQAAKDLDFMQAAQYRDEIIRLQKELEEKV